MSQFEQHLVESCVAAAPLEVSRTNYPWISAETTSIPTFLVKLHEGTAFRFGSLIGLNKTIEKIAHPVTEDDSTSTQTALFMGLPSVLRGQPTSGISRVENSKLPSSTLFIAARNLVSAPGLIFSVQAPEKKQAPHTVLRVGISTASERSKLLAVMGIKQAGGKRRRS